MDSENTPKRTVLQSVKHYALKVWEVPAVKSIALTWLIRLSVPGAPILIAVVDALTSTSNG